MLELKGAFKNPSLVPLFSRIGRTVPFGDSMTQGDRFQVRPSHLIEPDKAR